MWPFTSAYPEQSASDVDGKTFDYVIVGGGTAGCVIASRLSEDPSVSVLLICRGKVRDEWLFNIPLTAQMLLHNAPQVTRLIGEPDDRWTGQNVDAYTSQALGGASRVNGLMLTRGTPGTYNVWAELGNDEWSWEKCQPYFRKMENASLLPGGETKKNGRGYNGPLVLRHMPFVFGVDEYWDATAEDVGLPVSRDANDPDGPAMGIYNMDTMIDQDGLRLSAQRAYLPKSVAEGRRGRLTICSGAAATKLEISEDGTTVTGVHLVDVSSKKTSRQCFVKAHREVVVSCGTFFSPQVLQLSGIGPRKELEALNIPVVRNLPGVGANLKDHVSFAVVFETKPGDSNHALMRPLFVIWHIILWFIFKTGIFSSTTTKQCMWLRSNAIDDETMQVQHNDTDGHDNLDAKLVHNVPDIEAILTAAAVDHEWVAGVGYYAMYMTLTQPYSVGRMSLASSDPLALPKMHHPFITDDRDWPTARKAARFAMHTIERFRTKATGYSHMTVWHRAPGMKSGGTEGSWKTATDEDIDDFVRKRLCSTLHPTSTCRMAPEEDGGVVGQDLKVHGFENLRVADASVFPEITCAHTVAPTFMVAERCADFIKQSWA